MRGRPETGQETAERIAAREAAQAAAEKVGQEIDDAIASASGHVADAERMMVDPDNSDAATAHALLALAELAVVFAKVAAEEGRR